MSEITVMVDLRELFGPVRDQGARPTCLAFAASDTHAALRADWTPLSCEYAFYQAQRRAGRHPGSGALLSSILEALREDGQPEESGWPYLSAIPTDTTSWMPPSTVGALFARNGKVSAHSVDWVIHELEQKRPMIILLMLSQAFYQRNQYGVVDAAPDEIPQPERRHAVVALGHGTIDGQRAVLIRNSWGPNWGDSGYGWLTERFLEPRIYAAATLLEELNVSVHSNAA